MPEALSSTRRAGSKKPGQSNPRDIGFPQRVENFPPFEKKRWSKELGESVHQGV